MKHWMLFLLLLTAIPFFGQQVNPIVMKAVVIQGDTLPYVDLREVEVISILWPHSAREQRKLTKLIRDVKKVYPYARLAGIKLRQYDAQLALAPDEKSRRKLMKQAEQEITDQYGDDLKKMTFTQGKILIKLIDRETGDCSYELVQELRGKFTAFFYQAFARLWGYNLKAEYDPDGEDKQIEAIIRMIERGQL